MVDHEAPSAGSREKLLEVAEALFARRGFAGVGLREVAETAGLGKSSLFHHFKGKVQLYFAVLERVLRRMDLCLQPLFAAAIAPAARLLLRALFEDDDFAPKPLSEAESGPPSITSRRATSARPCSALRSAPASRSAAARTS